MTDPFASKLYSLIQNNTSPNVGDKIKLVTRNQVFMLEYVKSYCNFLSRFQDVAWQEVQFSELAW